jgi:sulfate adenylyltransferase
MTDRVNSPYGGELVNLIVGPERVAELQKESRHWPSWDLSPRQLCDIELLLNGGFSPLRGFLSRSDYESVCARMRLTNGLVWPIPVTLDVTDEFAGAVSSDTMVALRDPEGVMLARLCVKEVWRPDRIAEARAVYGTTNLHHPGVKHLLEQTHPWYVVPLRLPRVAPHPY